MQGKNLLPRKQLCFPFRVHPSSNGDKMNFDIVAPLKVYPVPLIKANLPPSGLILDTDLR